MSVCLDFEYNTCVSRITARPIVHLFIMCVFFIIITFSCYPCVAHVLHVCFTMGVVHMQWLRVTIQWKHSEAVFELTG